MTEFPNVTWDAIKKVAKYYGISRNYRAYHYRRTGHPTIDIILCRLEELRWTLRDLDCACETGTYFQNHQWRRFRPDFKKIERAIKELDGELRVVWKDYD